MGLKHKGSRLIHVGGDSYRWTVSRTAQAATGKFSVILEAIERPGRRLVVRLPSRDFWLYFRDVPDPRPTTYYRVTPSMVERIIAAALAAKWLPLERQRNLVCEWTEGEILIPLDPSQDVNNCFGGKA